MPRSGHRASHPPGPPSLHANRLRDDHLNKLQALQQEQTQVMQQLGDKTAQAAAAGELRERLAAAELR